LPSSKLHQKIFGIGLLTAVIVPHLSEKGYSILLQGLDPQQRQVGKWINNLFLADFVNQQIETNEYWRNFPQHPVFNNSGRAIQLIQGVKIDREETVSTRQPDICPYKGLQAFDFNETDPKYFYGRTALTGELIQKVRTGNFLAVLGHSGSGKSSVVRAGLLYQLKLGQRLLESKQWKILPVIRPGEYPLQSLAEAFAEGNKTALRLLKDPLNQNGAIALQEFVADVEAERVVLVIDQFEEAFTLCQGTAKQEAERQQFFECLLGALDSTENKLCVVITMRADFLGKCAEQEYAGLAKKIQEHLVTVTPMTVEELYEAICEPAKQVGLEVERRLVTRMIVDVKDSAGSLPLLQFSLTALWQQWHQQWQQGKPGLPNQLTLNSYNELGCLKGTLEEQANQVFQNLSTAQKEIAKWIFIELTQLGEDAEDTRRQVTKYQLVETLGRGEYSEDMVEEVIGILNDKTARLIVTSEENGVPVVDIAHEALIRHWDKLRDWVNKSREEVKQKRDIEKAALEWQKTGKVHEIAYLLQGRKLDIAESFLDKITLSKIAQEFVKKSIRIRTLNQGLFKLKKQLYNYRSQIDKAQDAIQVLEAASLDSDQFSQSLKQLDSYSTNLEEHLSQILEGINQ
jgi:energy-coupling factor transporter ATP-binding protein EcfA2